jgi:hypothetical protein
MISIDDVATGLLVNAITAAGRWLETAAGAARSGRGRASEYLAIARWFETYKLGDFIQGKNIVFNRPARLPRRSSHFFHLR